MIMNIKKIHFAIDKSFKAQASKKILLKKYKNYSAKKSDVIIVIGGDGFMLSTLKKYQKYNKPFYGMNRGSFGFLMNKFKNKNVLKSILRTKPVIISPLEMTATTKTNKTRTVIAINEVSLLRQSRQTAALRIIYGKNSLIKRLVCDGVLVSTPAGSTAYNLSVHGPILNLDSKKLAITPISPFRPRRWRGTVISEKSKINIKNLNVKKRPISAVADNHEVRNAKKIYIKINKKINFSLLFNKNNSLYKKIKIEQLRKETSTK